MAIASERVVNAESLRDEDPNATFTPDGAGTKKPRDPRPGRGPRYCVIVHHNQQYHTTDRATGVWFTDQSLRHREPFINLNSVCREMVVPLGLYSG